LHRLQAEVGHRFQVQAQFAPGQRRRRRRRGAARRRFRRQRQYLVELLRGLVQLLVGQRILFCALGLFERLH
jgi:hypothetical protein